MLAAANWRQALQLLQAADDSHAWQLRETPLAATGADCKPPAAPVLLDYHVCYSHSYQVPIMCFRAMLIDGGALGLCELQGLFPTWPRASEQLLGFVMQLDHPLLPGPPWLSLHPCNTATVLAVALGLREEEGPEELEAGAVDAPGEEGNGGGGVTAGAAGRAAAAAATISSTAAGAGGGSVAGVLAAGEGESGWQGAATPSAGAPAAMAEAKRTAPASSPPQRLAAAAVPPPLSIVGAAVAGAADEEDVPDLEELLSRMMAGADLAGKQSAVPAGPCGNLRRVANGTGTGGDFGKQQQQQQKEEEEEFARAGWPSVGPVGVRWRDGAVPLCRGDGGSLRRYMFAWMSLVAPHVGLRAPGPGRRQTGA